MRQRLVRAFSKAAKDSGLQDFHFHDLRHTFATRLAQAGVDLYKIAKLLGHNDISTTQRYAHHCPESLRSSVDILTEYYNSTTVESNAEGEPVHASA
jgi:site-specific recombinase XerD